jgi:hypothetical protein
VNDWLVSVGELIRTVGDQLAPPSFDIENAIYACRVQWASCQVA